MNTRNITKFSKGLLALVLTLCLAASAMAQNNRPQPSAEDIAKITAAAPAQATAKPIKPRKILVFYLCEGFYHSSIPWANKAIEIMGKKTGAYETVLSDDMKMFNPENLNKFDAVVFNSTTGLKFKDPVQRKALMDFIKGGKGVIGVHGATDNFNDFPEAAAMMGGIFNGHPWGAGGTWAMKIDEPNHPLNKGFAGKGFVISDEIYQVKGPYSRDTHRVLVSLDLDNERNKKVDPNSVKTSDAAISWLRRVGEGRVFYCSLGHNNPIFWQPGILQHYLDGVQYAMGDLKVDDVPSNQLKIKPTPALPDGAAVPLVIDGQSLDAFCPPTGDWFVAGDAMLDAGNDKLLKGKPGKGTYLNGATGRTVHLVSKVEHGDVRAHVEFMVPKGSNSGVYFMGRYEIQVFDSFGKDKVDSSDAGGIYQRWADNKGFEGRAPRVNVSKAPGQWQSFDVIFQAPRFDTTGKKIANAKFVKVYHNGTLIHENEEVTGMTRSGLTEEEKPFGPLMLQGDHGPVAYRNITLEAWDGKMGIDTDTLKALAAYDFGKSTAVLASIQGTVTAASPDAFGEIEAGLLTVLTDAKASYAARQYVCRMLRRMGSVQSVPALAALLTDKEMSHMALFALQGMNAKEVDVALLDALGKASGNERIGVIGTIGQRGDRTAVAALAKLAGDSDQATAGAAVNALGRVGGMDASKALAGIKSGDKRIAKMVIDAQVMCADSILEDGKAAEAAKVYRSLMVETNPSMVRAAALRGLVAAEKGKVIPTVLELLKSDDKEISLAAANLVASIPGTEATKAFGSQLPSLPAGVQVVLLSALTRRGDKAAAADVTPLMSSKDEAVRVAAIRALGVLGSTSSVEELAKAISAGGAVAQEAVSSLTNLRGRDVGTALVAMIDAGKAKEVRVACMDILVNRREIGAVSHLLATANDSDADVRKASYVALGALAQQSHLRDMVALYLVADVKDRASIEKALNAMALRIKNADSAAATVTAALSKADAPARAGLLSVLGRLGGERAQIALRESLSNSDVEVRKSAIRALSAWNSAAPAKDLLKVAGKDSDAMCRILALRGYVALCGLPSKRSAGETVKMYESAMETAQRIDEKKMVLSAAGSLADEAALKFVEKYLDDAELKVEAETAYQSISKALGGLVVIVSDATLTAKEAKVNGDGAGYESGAQRDCIGNYANPDTTVSWEVYFRTPGTYEVGISQSMADTAGSTYDVLVGDQKVSGASFGTGDWGKFEAKILGRVRVDTAGKRTITFKPTKKVGGFVINLRSITLKKVD